MDDRPGCLVARGSDDARPIALSRLLLPVPARTTAARRAAACARRVGVRLTHALSTAPRVAAERLLALYSQRRARFSRGPSVATRLSLLQRVLGRTRHPCPSPALDEVFRFQRTLLACASGRPVEPAWVGPCAPGALLGLSRDLLGLLASLDADGGTVVAEYLPDRGWEFPRLRRCRCRPWVLLSIGERLSLISAVVALLRGRGA